MRELLTVLANADDGNAVLKLVLPWTVTFASMVLTVVFKHRAKRAEDRVVKIDPPVPTLDVRQIDQPPSAERLRFLENDVKDLKEDVELRVKEIKDILDNERTVARKANGNIHARIDALSERLGERLSTLEGETKAVGENVSRLLDIALSKPKRS